MNVTNHFLYSKAVFNPQQSFCSVVNGIKILQEKVERVGYPPDGENYMDDSKEILKSLLGDDIEEEEDDVTSEREDARECDSGQQEENLDENENEEGGTVVIID